MVTVTLTKVLFTAFVLLVVGQRLWEVQKSRRHERVLRKLGAQEAAPGQMPIMKTLHGAWFVAMLFEVWLFDRSFLPWLALGALCVFSIGQWLRMRAMGALGERWTVNIMVLPEAPPVNDGIFRTIRHPNYLGVILEIAALPLVHGAWLTAAFFTVANGLMLFARIRAEESALGHTGEYQRALGSRPRFLPFTEAKP